MRANADIREKAKEAGVCLWEVAAACGVNDGNFSRKLRLELPQEEKEKILDHARIQAQRIIEDARIAANSAAEEIKAIKKQLSEAADMQGINQRQAELRRNLNDAEGKLRAQNQPQNRQKPTRKIM